MRFKYSTSILPLLFFVILANSTLAVFERGPNNLLSNFNIISKRNQPSILSSSASNKHSAVKSNKRRINTNQNKSASMLNSPCPVECACQGLSVDCSSRGLKHVPKNIPTNAIRLWAIRLIINVKTNKDITFHVFQI